MDAENDPKPVCVCSEAPAVKAVAAPPCERNIFLPVDPQHHLLVLAEKA